MCKVLTPNPLIGSRIVSPASRHIFLLTSRICHSTISVFIIFDIYNSLKLPYRTYMVSTKSFLDVNDFNHWLEFKYQTAASS